MLSRRIPIKKEEIIFIDLDDLQRMPGYLVISLVVSALVSSYFEGRLENSKNRVAMVMHQKDEFDSSQNNLVTELGLYTGRVLDSRDPKKREKLDAAIVAAQQQVHNLANELGDKDSELLTAYANQLETMRKQLEEVSGPRDLAPIYISAQEILKLHDKVGEQVNNDLTAFSRASSVGLIGNRHVEPLVVGERRKRVSRDGDQSGI